MARRRRADLSAVIAFLLCLAPCNVNAFNNDNNSTLPRQNLRNPSVEAATVTTQTETAAAFRKLGVVADKTIERYKAVPAGQKQHPSYYSESYLPRATPHLTDDQLKALEEEYGYWKVVDPKADSRPLDDFYNQYPNRDVPGDKFPDTAWQRDKEYLEKFIPEALALTSRAMEAILAEYGRGKNDLKDMSLEQRAQHFSLTVGGEHRQSTNTGGWMPEASFDGLKRRLLHAIMTQDRFNIAMAGHSAAAGHGNHFVQAYTGQMQRILEPLLARLGVKSVARNFGMGGLGTQQTFMAAADIYGREIDVLLWDSSMTEKDGAARGVLAIQSLIGCDRAPLLWFQNDKDKTLYQVHQKTGADIGVFGTGNPGGYPKATTAEQLANVSWAVRHFACSKEIQDLCKERYHGKCWVDRKGFTWEGIDLSLDKPPVNQKPEPGGRASWHPGDREHQLQARALVFPILQALREVLTTWSKTPDYKLEDKQWHMTEYYNAIKTKVNETSADWEAWCTAKMINVKFCKYRAKGRTENTPRARPWETSIRAIVSGSKHPYMNPQLNSYDPPDVYQPSLFPPNGSVNVLAIIENGVPYAKNVARIADSAEDFTGVRFTEKDAQDAKGSKFNPDIKPGKGWQHGDKAGSDNCDGEHDSFCGRSTECLLYGHNDGRAGLTIDGFSGWGVFTLPGMEQGIIVIKIHSWAFYAPTMTNGWTCENNDCPKARALSDATVANSITRPEEQRERQLKPAVPPYCADFKLEYAVDGVITSLNQAEIEKLRKNPERVVEVLELYNNETFADGGGARDVEFALRITGCGRSKPYDLTHIYWI